MSLSRRRRCTRRRPRPTGSFPSIEDEIVVAAVGMDPTITPRTPRKRIKRSSRISFKPNVMSAMKRWFGWAPLSLRLDFSLITIPRRRRFYFGCRRKCSSRGLSWTCSENDTMDNDEEPLMSETENEEILSWYRSGSLTPCWISQSEESA